MSKTDLGPNDEKDWRLKEGRNRGAGCNDIPLLYCQHCQVTTSQWLQHTAPESLEQAAQRTKPDSVVLRFPKQNLCKRLKKAVYISANLCVTQFI